MKLRIKCDCCGDAFPLCLLWRTKLMSAQWTLPLGFYRFCLDCLPWFNDDKEQEKP